MDYAFLVAIEGCFISAVVGGIVSLFIRRLEKKVDKMDEESRRRHIEQVEIRTAERELLLAEAHISELVVRKMRDEQINGDLEEADRYLEEKTKAVQDLTRRIYMEYTEGVHS